MLQSQQTEMVTKISNWLSPRFDKYESILTSLFLVVLLLRLFTDLPVSFFMTLVLVTLAQLYFFKGFSTPEDPNAGAIEKLIDKVSALSLSVCIVGMLFRLEYWPGYKMMIMLGSITLIIIFPVILILQSKKPELIIFSRRMKLRVVIVAALGLFLYYTPVDKLIELGITKDVKTEQVDFRSSENTLYIDVLNGFYESEDYYISLYYRGDYSDAVSEKLKNARIENVSVGNEEIRMKLDEEIVRTYLYVDNLDSLLVFDIYQNIIDTIVRLSYEYHENGIESFYVATYRGRENLSGNLVISLKGYDKVSHEKSPAFIDDSVYFLALCRKNNFNADDIYGSGYIIHSVDTISFLSYSDYKNGKDCFYLLKNGLPKDSVINDYIVSGMIPVPVASEAGIFYVASESVPETDNLWTSFIGIDTGKTKLVHYNRNRFRY